MNEADIQRAFKRITEELDRINDAETKNPIERSSAGEPQPVPKPGKTKVLDSVIADLQARAEVGLQTYGTYLETDNGRDALRDAYDEAQDQVMYLKQAILERASASAALDSVENAITRDVDKLVDELKYYAAFPHLDHVARMRKAIDMLERLKPYIKKG